jgi:hypothetical protein
MGKRSGPWKPLHTKVTVVSELPHRFMVIREKGEIPFKISKESL